MTKRADLEAVLGDYQRDAAELIAKTVLRLRTIIENPDVEPQSSWVEMKEAEFQTKRTRKVIRPAAIRSDALWQDDSNRIWINLAKLKFGPPKG